MVLQPEDIVRARDAIIGAKNVRGRHARRTSKDDPVRRSEIRSALLILKSAMKPIRTFLARTQYDPDAPGRFEALNLSFQLQRERRKLWKLKQPGRHSDAA